MILIFTFNDDLLLFNSSCVYFSVSLLSSLSLLIKLILHSSFSLSISFFRFSFLCSNYSLALCILNALSNSSDCFLFSFYNSCIKFSNFLQCASYLCLSFCFISSNFFNSCLCFDMYSYTYFLKLLFS